MRAAKAHLSSGSWWAPPRSALSGERLRVGPTRPICASRSTIPRCPSPSGASCSSPTRTASRDFSGGALGTMAVSRGCTPPFLNRRPATLLPPFPFCHAATASRGLSAASLCCGLLSVLPLPQHQRADRQRSRRRASHQRGGSWSLDLGLLLGVRRGAAPLR